MEEKNIKMVEKRYYKAGSKWVLSESKEENISKENYLNFINSCKFFRNLGGYERLISGYTYSGHIPVQLNSISPDKQEKIIRSFEFNKNTGSIYYDQKKKEYR